MIRSYLNIDNTTLGEQLFKNKQITKVSPSNSYEMLLTSNQIKEIVSNVIDLIESHYNQKIEIYIKNLWGYIQNNDELQNLTINPFIYNEGISIKPKWSFLYFVETDTSKIKFNINSDFLEINFKKGELVVFESDYFVKDMSNDTNRIVLVGSITNSLSNTNQNKSLI